MLMFTNVRDIPGQKEVFTDDMGHPVEMLAKSRLELNFPPPGQNNEADELVVPEKGIGGVAGTASALVARVGSFR